MPVLNFNPVLFSLPVMQYKPINNRHMKVMTALLLLFTTSLLSCKDKDKDNKPSRDVKYEITGNFTGRLLILFNDNINGNTMVSNAAVPWSKDVTYTANVVAVSIGGHATTVGAPGQTVSLKIYAGGQLVRSGSATAGALGELSLPALTYSF